MDIFLPPRVYYNFFQDRCIRAVGSGGKWAVCKAFGNVRQFFYLLDGMGYVVRSMRTREPEKRGTKTERFLSTACWRKRVQVYILAFHAECTGKIEK